MAATVAPDPGRRSTPATAAGAEAHRGESGPEMISLEQVLAIGLPVSADLERSQQRVARDQALVRLGIASRMPQLTALASGSFTQVGTSVGVITSLPTLGDISLGLRQDGYAQLQNSFGNLGLVLDLNLLPLRQTAELSAFRSGLASSRAALGETERQVRFDLVSAYRDLQLRQALIPVWEKALEASTALERDAEAIQRRGLAARIDVLRSQALRARDLQGLAEARAELGRSRQHLAALLSLPPQRAPLASDPLQPQPLWPFSLEDSLEKALKERPLLESLRAQQQAQTSLAQAARSVMLPSLSLLVGGGLSGNRLAAPVLSNGGSLDSSVGSLGLPNLEQSSVAAGSFYNWGAALLLRQPLYDGGRAQSGAAVAERERDLLAADTDLARRRIRDTVSASWSSLQASDTVLNAARAGVVAGERALRDAQLRYRALVEPLTELLLVQRDLQAARASLLTALARQSIERAVLERETGITDLDPMEPKVVAPVRR
jgi:outer membrane protein